ncbi:hypothetical protein [Bradyrhizobium sp. McL0616]|uniref:hypothetical protein n=1 Tax=Bradyrhizobium sp. McL0616 TaxID=3415674 RepID=UPI003CE70ED9
MPHLNDFELYPFLGDRVPTVGLLPADVAGLLDAYLVADVLDLMVALGAVVFLQPVEVVNAEEGVRARVGGLGGSEVVASDVGP